MDWLSFFIGVLVGWIVEWIIDFFYWRRRYHSWQVEKEDLQARLTEAEKRLKTYQVEGWEPETRPQRIASAQVATQQDVEPPPTMPLQPDDLKLIEGIGPKISQLLAEHGILTFAQLADTSHDRLESILKAGGPNFQLADPTTWPKQAKLAADGDWAELQELQNRLIGGYVTRH